MIELRLLGQSYHLMTKNQDEADLLEAASCMLSQEVEKIVNQYSRLTNDKILLLAALELAKKEKIAQDELKKFNSKTQQLIALCDSIITE